MPGNERQAAIAALAALLTLLPAPARACTITATGVAFGTYDALLGTADDGVGSVVARCHPNVQAPSIALSAGSNGNFSPRKMRSGSAGLNYNLYTSAARAFIWGNGSGGTVTVQMSGGTVGAGTRTFTQVIYGRIPPRQNVAAGTYGDTIMVTLTF